MATGEAIGCFALTEPEAGSDPGSMTTTAVRDGSDWVLNGHKKWNTNGWVSDVAIVWAKDDEGLDARVRRAVGCARAWSSASSNTRGLCAPPLAPSCTCGTCACRPMPSFPASRA